MPQKSLKYYFKYRGRKIEIKVFSVESLGGKEGKIMKAELSDLLIIKWQIMNCVLWKTKFTINI